MLNSFAKYLLCARRSILGDFFFFYPFPKTLIPDYEVNDDGLFLLETKRGAMDIVCKKANG